MPDAKPNSKKRGYLLPSGCKNIGDVVSKKKPVRLKVRVNGRISAKRVELRNEYGKKIGVLGLGLALDRARSEGLDIVEVDPNANPPICLLVDYGKFKYRSEKKRPSKDLKTTRSKNGS